MKPTRSTCIALMVLFGQLSIACSDPCGVLEATVCDEQEDAARCAMIQDPERRELLTRDTCEGILETMEAKR